MLLHPITQRPFRQWKEVTTLALPELMGTLFARLPRDVTREIENYREGDYLHNIQLGLEKHIQHTYDREGPIRCQALDCTDPHVLTDSYINPSVRLSQTLNQHPRLRQVCPSEFVYGVGYVCLLQLRRFLQFLDLSIQIDCHQTVEFVSVPLRHFQAVINSTDWSQVTRISIRTAGEGCFLSYRLHACKVTA